MPDSGSTTAADVAAMQKGQGVIADLLGQLMKSQNDMTAQRDNLSSSWQSDSGSATTFIGALNDWLDQLGHVQNDLNKILDALNQNTGVYVQASAATSDAASNYAHSAAQSLNIPGLTF